MTYQDFLARIYGLRRFGVKPGLERVSLLLERLSNPHLSLKVVHVVGTNGKGSTAAFLSSIMTASGSRTGLFTSPHLTSFTERFRINGVEMAEDTLLALGERVFAAAPEGTTFFEIVTALALLCFAEEGVDLAILEAGMGGGADATCVAPGMLTVITPISLDHCEYLGKTIEAIADEKVAIVKAGTPVVTALQDAAAAAVISSHCNRVSSPLYSFGRGFSSVWREEGLCYQGKNHDLSGLHPGIPGSYQSMNAACALFSAELLGEAGFPLSVSALKLGIEAAFWPGRMELFGTAPRILLDGAHNPAGGRALAEALSEIPRRRLLVVVGVMGDKDAAGILAPLFPLADCVYAVSPAIERSLPAERLAALCREQGIVSVAAGSVAEGIDAATGAAAPEDLVLVCGSLFTVGEARSILLGRTYEPFRG